MLGTNKLALHHAHPLSQSYLINVLRKWNQHTEYSTLILTYPNLLCISGQHQWNWPLQVMNDQTIGT